ncbi:hypothetical protein AMATHDRAFT_80477 [Amanita thiersii Skay4041]|uniref:BRCT domain-containing protein n=1 Tax=Amanita thiersii Skay4041 TaxID=703135 RepID=A0A2A9NP53_9AGAR|nr:hypothetical protein AMATHDRAFT_80477 [Amanita thiersii Skay4041]
MRRRGNKSHKVPNVKLRPAQPTPTATTSRPIPEDESMCWAQETQEASLVDPCPRPFKGVSVCATGIPDKLSLFRQALELGATSTSALTDRVTHLIATEHGGAKYWCAVERQVPVMKPSWITESYEIWLRGDDVDLNKSIAAHKLPAFSGLVLSLSGSFDDAKRADIKKRVAQHDGKYLENLERPIRITHILCSSNEETDKIRYARRFTQRGEANIRLVWEEWFWDSVDFGGRMNEDQYDIQNPRPKRRTLLVEATPPPSIPSRPSNASPSDPLPPTPLPNADDDDIIACVAHRPAVTLQIWGNLLKRRGYEVVGGKMVKGPSAQKQVPPDMQPAITDTENVGGDTHKAKSVISTFRRANSFAPVNDALENASQRVLPFRRTMSMAAVQSAASQAGNGAEAGPSTIHPRGIFSGLRFRVLGEARTVTVRNAIEQAGGVWATEMEMDEGEDYIIVRLVSGSKIYREEPDIAQRIKYRTECWLERCLFEERLCPYEDHITFVPLSIQIPILGTENIIMSFSGLDQSEICWLTRLLRALGIQLAPAFSRRTTHLLCPSGTGLKFEKACEWGIPVVNRDWLAAIATSGSVLPVSKYLVKQGVANEQLIAEDTTHTSRKGKGKATESPSDLGDTENGTTKVNLLRPPRKENSLPSRTTQVTKQVAERHVPPPTQPPEPPNSNRVSFGKPTTLLGVGVTPSTPPRPSAALRNKDSSLSRQPTVPVDYETARETVPQSDDLPPDEEIVAPPVPSSKTPSPMKIPRSGSSTSLVSVAIDIEATKALQESIASLLGKRQGDEDTHHDKERTGKRPRPRRIMSKQSSTSSLDMANVHLASEPDPPFNKPLNEYDPFAEDAMEDTTIQGNITRIMYEDPGQADERKRLMSLLTNSNSPLNLDVEMTGPGEAVQTRGTGHGKSQLRTRTRRSTRVAAAASAGSSC